MARPLPELSAEIDSRLSRELSEKRAAHSRGVAEFAAELCARHGIDPERGRLAGLAHDLCKELPAEEQRRRFGSWLAARGRPGDWALSPAAGSPGLAGPGAGEGRFPDEVLHGPAAALLLERDYGLDEADILEAVAWHTLGRADMGPLAVFVYCADKVEPGRKHVDASFRELCLGLEPRDMLAAVVGQTVEWLGRKGREIAPATLFLYNALRNPDKAP
jgi:nicotinate-nucleotide adenylyltransferase